ncbi:hypothetical protein SAMN04487949_3852 [Halogranum gelatinilyticum]|uniref:NIPSNAP protein n=1 Tax=Halogranum gelatinilyticum TaxID=660521 RepID=A0A1H0A6K4_9EURY|nr:hypothetical protein [Halogranum gelatinilyticum]SDN29248.1 hypothetical protein SAMN04487949_3852 [Halogranum gelatinilyticum]
MPYLLIRHRLRDYTIWKPAFGDHAATHEAAGCLGGGLFHVADDRTEIVALLEWDTLDNARALADSADLDERMQWVGVEGTPEFTLLEKLEDVAV